MTRLLLSIQYLVVKMPKYHLPLIHLELLEGKKIQDNQCILMSRLTLQNFGRAVSFL
jgi:hypothetical protein